MMSDRIPPVKAFVPESSPACLRCGGPMRKSVPPSRGPHHARLDCPACGAWRWAPKPRAAAGAHASIPPSQDLPSAEHGFQKCGDCGGWIRPQQRWEPACPENYFTCQKCGCVRRKRDGQ
jgi:hypothetical protein